MSIDLQLGTALKKWIKDKDAEVSADIAGGSCLGNGHIAIPFEYGHSTGYLVALRELLIIIDQTQEQLIKGDDK